MEIKMNTKLKIDKEYKYTIGFDLFLNLYRL